jgi:hypothetical protein
MLHSPRPISTISRSRRILTRSQLERTSYILFLCLFGFVCLFGCLFAWLVGDVRLFGFAWLFSWLRLFCLVVRGSAVVKRRQTPPDYSFLCCVCVCPFVCEFVCFACFVSFVGLRVCFLACLFASLLCVCVCVFIRV